MATKKVDVFLHRKIESGEEEIFKWDDMSDLGYVLAARGVCEMELVPESVIVNRQIDALKVVKEAVLAEAHTKVVAIEQKIQSLLAITHEVQS